MKKKLYRDAEDTLCTGVLVYVVVWIVASVKSLVEPLFMQKYRVYE